MSLGLLLLVVTLACVVSHKFREGMEVEERLDKMEDKLDDIYEEVVGEERIKTGRYLFYDKGESLERANKLINIKILKKGENEYRLIVMRDFKDIDKDLEIEKLEYDLELFSDNSVFSKNVNSDKDTVILLFDKDGRYFISDDDIFLVNEKHIEDFMKKVKEIKEENGGKVSNDNLVRHFRLNISENEALKRHEEERVKRVKRED